MTARREVKATLRPIEAHCGAYRDLFEEVRTFENFQALHVGLLAELPRKSLPAIANFLGLSNAQGLHHLLSTPHVETAQLMERRLAMIREALGGRAVTLMIDETGSRKKGSTTDYVARQYLGSLGKIDNGLVTVHLVALVGELTFPLGWRVFKPQSRLREGESHQSKLALAVELLDEVSTWGLRVALVVADSAYGMSHAVMGCIQRHGWSYALAIRSDFALLLGPGQEVWSKPWVSLPRHFNDGTSEQRWAQEVIWHRPREERYVLLTSDPEQQPENETSFVRTNLQGDDGLLRLADAYGSRTWIEATFRNLKAQLGWHDWRLTRWEHIARWFELVLSAYTLLSLHALSRQDIPDLDPITEQVAQTIGIPGWRADTRWVDALHNLRALVRPLGALVTLSLWTHLFPIDARLITSSFRILFAIPLL